MEMTVVLILGELVQKRGCAILTLVSCEHYNPKINKDHLHDTSIGDGSYHVEYMEAIFFGDEQEAAQIEESAFNLGYGPLIDCSTVANCSQQKAYCREFIYVPAILRLIAAIQRSHIETLKMLLYSRS